MWQKPKFWVVLIAIAIGAFLVQQFWKWEVERIEVPPGKFLVLIHRWGRDLAPDEILAPDSSFKGVQLEVQGPGRYFYNPILWAHEIHDMVNVPNGKCLVLTRKYGKLIDPDRILEGDLMAREGERGIVEKPYQPGSYPINPYAYDYKLEDAIEIKAEMVGVRTLKVGRKPPVDPRGQGSPYLVKEDDKGNVFRGVQERYVQPGTYYVNPNVESIIPVEIRSHKVDFTDIQFPSRDGFQLRPNIQVEYAVMKEKAPEVFVRVTDLGELMQKDSTKAEIDKNEILQKIILPHVRGFARIEGSNFNAADFIVVGTGEAQKLNSREAFQKALLEAVRPRCEKMGIEIRAITLATMDLPKELTDEISARDRALAEQERNREMVKQYKQEQSLKAEEGKAAQKREKVQAETRLKQAETQQDQLIKVEKQKLTTALTVAQTQLDAAREKAKSIRAAAKSKADVIQAENKAEVAALKKSVEGFGGAQHFAQYQVLSRIAPALAEIFASDNGDFGRLFSTLLQQTQEGGATRMPTEAARPNRPATPNK